MLLQLGTRDSFTKARTHLSGESSDSAPLGVFIGQILFCDKHALELLACGFLFCSALEAFPSSPAPA
jgi:hypothetical protein